MAYRFKLKEDLREGVRRIATEQIDRALAAPHSGDHRAGWVHDTRKALKRTRALLRCVRDGLGDKLFREENAILRLIAGNLSSLRDHDVMADTIEGFRGRDDDLDEALGWLGGVLADPAVPKAAPSARSATAAVRQAVKALETARSRLEKLEVTGEIADVVAAGIRSCQRTGRKTVSRLAADPSDENVHELRKAVQTYQRQQTLVLAVWPEQQGARIEAARRLSQVLGEAQDLAVLAATAKVHGKEADQNELADRIIAACRERQAELREVAMPLASRLFALRPKAAALELAAGWRAAIDLAAAPDVEPRAAVRRRSTASAG
jgi:CHAD domain-containing protein